MRWDSPLVRGTKFIKAMGKTAILAFFRGPGVSKGRYNGISIYFRPFLGVITPFITGTWRIIPFSKWLINMVSKSPNWGCSPYKWPKWLINGGY